MPAIPKILKNMCWFPKINLALKSTATAVTIGKWSAALGYVVLLAQDSDWKSCVSKKKWLWFLRLVCPYPIFSPVKIQQYGGWLSPSLLFSCWLYISIWEHPISIAVETTMRKRNCRLEVSMNFSPSISPMPCMHFGLLFLLILQMLIHLSCPLT